MSNQITPITDNKDQEWLKDTFTQNSLADMAYIKLANNFVFNININLF